jgi:hypothetical protein
MNGCSSNCDGQTGTTSSPYEGLSYTSNGICLLINGYVSTANTNGPVTGAAFSGAGYTSVTNALFAGTSNGMSGAPSNFRALATRIVNGSVAEVPDNA